MEGKMKKVIIFYLLLVGICIYSKTISLLDNDIQVINLNYKFDVNHINDIEYINNNEVIFSSSSNQIDFYLFNLENNNLSKINLVEKLSKKYKNISENFKIILLDEIYINNSNSLNFYCFSNQIRFNGYYNIDLKNNFINYLTDDLLKYKELIYKINLDSFPKRNEFIKLILDKNIIFYQQDENEYDNYREIYIYNIKTKEDKLFYEKATQSEWIVLDDELIICAGHPGVLILNKDGVILEYYSNLFYSSVALSPDKSKIIFNGGIFSKDQIDFTDSEGFYDDANLLVYGLLVFKINQKAKKKLIDLSESIKNIDEKKRIREFTLPDKKKKFFLNYTFFFIPKFDDLVLFETQDFSKNIVCNLKKGQKLEYLESGKSEIIEDREGRWIKLKTDKDEIGWCVDIFFEEVKKGNIIKDDSNKESNWFLNFFNKIFGK